MSVKPNMATEAHYRELGRKARDAARLVEKYASKARLQWLKIGQYGAEVRDSAPPRSGVLGRWRVQYLEGVVRDVELSDAIWCHEHPKAIALIRETITNPQNIRAAWRKVANDAVADFVAAGRNDTSDLADKLGVDAAYVQTLINKAHASQQRAAKAKAQRESEKRSEELTQAVETGSGIMFDDPIPGGDPLTGVQAMRQAVAQLDELDVKGARRTLLEAIRESGE